jgi:hypothetical protein
LFGKYGDKVNFVVVYVIEPHPWGQPSPYNPSFNQYSEQGKAINGDYLYQPDNHEWRRSQAARMRADLGVLPVVLVDEMDNPVWCTYGPMPNCAYLIGTDGTIIEKESWYQPDLMEKAIRAYLGLAP